MDGKIYDIRAGFSFVDVLAAHLLQKYENKQEELSKVLILLPNRRACQSLAEAFVRLRGLSPTILPEMSPLADVEEDEIYLSGNKELLDGLLPAIDSSERVLLFTRMILQKPDWGGKRVSLVQAYALAKNLSSLMDNVYLQELSFADLAGIVTEKYAVHWQQTLELLKIITQYWPQILRERGAVNAAERRCKLLETQMNIWKKDNSKRHIIVAGSTAAFPILKRLVKTVTELKNGKCYLYGLDKYLDEEAWKNIEETHPQYELKELLEFLEINREEVADLGEAPVSAREELVSKIMLPAESSGAWRNLNVNPLPDSAFENIKLVNCDDVRQEAKAIALIIRKNLEIPEKTTALVTMDRNLSRRVISELAKWGISADDSAGQPLNLSPIGIYLRLILNYVAEKTQTAMMALLKHPFTACGESYAEFNQKVRHLELTWRRGKELSDEQKDLLKNFEERLYPLAEIYENSEADVKKLFCAHIKVAESLADTDLKSGDKIIWRQDAGKTAGDFVMSFMEKCNNLENIQTIDYEGFFNTLLSEYNVRSRYGMHPRVKILGPIEARLTQYDTVIIGEANEGCWPQMPRADMWMSRPMKKDFGLPQPERAVGVAAADFAHLLNAPEVYVTRAKKVDGAPSNKSRWWLRFETVLAANFNSQADKYDFIYEQPFSVWARNLDSCAEPRACAAPAPCPPVEHRPRILSATNVDNLRRDPYTIYAKYILDLYPLDDLDKEDSASDYGSFIHEVLQKFNDLHNRDYPEKEKAEAELLKIAEEKLKDKHIKDETAALWRERILQQLKWIVETEIRYREDIDLVHNEIKGQIKLNAPAGDFTITAKADRLDETKDGYVNIIDYKTGKSASVRAVVAGNAPQLPIEGIIAEAGGFADVLPQMVKSFQYWDFKTVKTTSEEQSRKAMEVTVKNLAELLADFDNPETPYIANPVRGLGSDYAHLSRFLEWSVKEDVVEEEDENE